MRNDAAPIGHTCPMIDDIIYFIKDIEWDDQEIDLQKESEKALNILEKIRSANSTLREWGNEQYQRAEEAEKEVDYYKDRVSILEDEIADLKKQIEELEQTQEV